MLFIINNHRSHFLSRPLPPVGPLRELVINDVNFSLQLEIMCSQFRKKGWNDGLFCVVLLFVMVMSVVFPVLPIAEATPEHAMLVT